MLIDTRHKIKHYLDRLVLGLGLISLVSFIAVIGFYLEDFWFNVFKNIAEITLYFFVIQELARFLIVYDKKEFLKSRYIEVIITVLILFRLLFPYSSMETISYILPELTLTEITLLFIGVSQLVVVFSIFIRALRYNNYISMLNLHSGAIIAISFIMVISIGTMMLLLPRAVLEDKSLSFIDALFTSTSAVCVTGLVVVDTSSHFSPIGRIIIATLIQVGGLGLMTLTTFFAVMFAGGLSVRVKVFMKDLLSQESMTEGAGLLKRILLFTFIVEYVGSILLYISLAGSFDGIDRDLYYDCLFHSISAFCNAGFSVYSDGLMFHTVQSNYWYSSVIMALIVLGGIGFFTLTDVTRNIFSFKKFSRLKISSKIVLITTLVLIFGGMLVFMLFENQNNQMTTILDHIFQSLFLSITSRTAGFNTISIELLTPASVMFMIILMWIGASPGSTGGGIKTTTIAVTVITLLNLIRGKERVEVFNREIYPENIRQSAMVIISSLIFLGIGTTLLVWLEPHLDPLDLIFEATSAISTVGLSRNLTYSLNLSGKVIIIILMFVGRIGVLTFFLSLYKPKVEPHYKLPYEKIMVG